MKKEEINSLKEHLYEIYKYQKSFGQDSGMTYDMSIELLFKVCKTFDYLQQENKQLKEKIDKAIKYIEVQQKIFRDYDIVSENQLKNLLEILRGDSNE